MCVMDLTEFDVGWTNLNEFERDIVFSVLECFVVAATNIGSYRAGCNSMTLTNYRRRQARDSQFLERIFSCVA